MPEAGRLIRQIAMGPTLYRGRLKALREEQPRYARVATPEEIHAVQLARLNSVWTRCVERVPFYRRWVSEHSLPPRFRELSDLREFPKLTKETLQEHADEVFEHGRIKSSVLTGGSTGAPVRYPWSTADACSAFANMYTGRAWWGIRPFDAQVAFWGHSHAFGTDRRRHLRAAKRRIGYLASNTAALSAYDLGLEAMSRQYRRLQRLRPAYLYGYTSALFRLAKYIESVPLPVPFGSPLKGVIMTSETVTAGDMALIERVFGAPAIVEYGAAEIGPVAYSSPGADGLRVFWNSFIVQADGDGNAVITTIGNRLFPLINYDIGDAVDAGSETLLELRGITGRTADVVRIGTRAGGVREVIGRVVVHVLKSHPDVLAIQIRQTGPRAIDVLLAAHVPIDVPAARARLLDQMTGEYPDLSPECIRVRHVREPTLTVAGKTQLLV